MSECKKQLSVYNLLNNMSFFCGTAPPEFVCLKKTNKLGFSKFFTRKPNWTNHKIFNKAFFFLLVYCLQSAAECVAG